MIKREIETELQTLLTEFPIVTVLGPRQAGKTTLVKSLPNYQYSNLEDPRVRELAKNDPKAYLGQFTEKVIIDEIQRVPSLLSYIQLIVDEKKENGQFVLTGSHQLQLHKAVTQSLAGRTAILKLLPFSISELKKSKITFDSFSDYCFHGFMPRIYDQKVRPGTLYSNYYETYVERDVRQLINIKDLGLFEKFFKLLAGRVGQLMDYEGLSNDTGVSAKTIKNWLSVLEASYIIFKLSPYHNNFGKRAIKSPKYYFVDVGLLCFLLGIQNEGQISRDPLVGNIFENLVIADALKCRFNQGGRGDLYFFRDGNNNEVDLIFENGRELVPIEIKSSSTYAVKFGKGIRYFQSLAKESTQGYLIYSGDMLPETSKLQCFFF